MISPADGIVRTHRPTVLDAADVSRIRIAASAAGALNDEGVRDRMATIHADLGAGDIDAAYDAFSQWIRQEARYAKSQRATNMTELVTTMLGMIDWMYERVPRAIVQSAASVSQAA